MAQSWCGGARVQVDGVRWSQRQAEEKRGKGGKKKEKKKAKGRSYHDTSPLTKPSMCSKSLQNLVWQTAKLPPLLYLRRLYCVLPLMMMFTKHILILTYRS